MWGNLGNFSDLAKAAQELQEQAASSMGSSSAAGGFFNMDSLQGPAETEKKQVPDRKVVMKQQAHHQEALMGTYSYRSPSQLPPPRSIGNPIPYNASNHPSKTATVSTGSVSASSSPSKSNGKLVMTKGIMAATTATATATAKPSKVTKLETIQANATGESGFFDDYDDSHDDEDHDGKKSAPSTHQQLQQQQPQSQPQPQQVLDTMFATPLPPSKPITNTISAPTPPTLRQSQTAAVSPQRTTSPPMEHRMESTGATGSSSSSSSLGAVAPSTSTTMMEPFEEDSMVAQVAKITNAVDVADKDHHRATGDGTSTTTREGVDTEAAGTTVEESGSSTTATALEASSVSATDSSPPRPVNGMLQSLGPTVVVAAAAAAAAVVVESSSTESPLKSQAVPSASLPSPSPSVPVLPDQTMMMEQFSLQLERLEANHQSEQQVIQRQHAQELTHVRSTVQDLQQTSNRSHADWTRRQEGYELQLDSLKRELEGTQDMLQAKQKEERKLQDVHLNQLRGMEKDMNKKEATGKGFETQLKDLEKALDDSKAKLQTSHDEYETLKGRVKVVAGELKERRANCRTLASEVDILNNTNNGLTDKITHLEAQGMDMDKSSQESTAEVSALRGKIMDQQKGLDQARSAIQAATTKGEDALAAYKKKAQQSLWVANGRAASAAQAREEAELDARAARSTADTAMERAVVAELKGKAAMAEAKVYVTEMEERVAQLDAIQAELDQATAQLEQTKLDASAAQESNEKSRSDLQSLQGRFETEHSTNENVREDLTQATNRSMELFEEVERLRRESQKLHEDLQRVTHQASNGSDEDIKNSTGGKDMEMVPAKRTAEAEATIAMLQRELQDANQAIRELKETLKATVEEQATNAPADGASTSAQSNGGHYDHHHHNGRSESDGGGMPLFYAMEKQAELTQARNEIARLAGLLGDSESSKQEAIEDMEEMGRHLEKVQSQLGRQNRLSSPQEQQVNLEYLKNVVLSFLNAKTIAEKKALLPVIGTVLCLTPEEQRKATDQLEKDGQVSLDSVANSFMSLKWS